MAEVSLIAENCHKKGNFTMLMIFFHKNGFLSSIQQQMARLLIEIRTI
ncbi:hypothetical protein H6G58_15545 [Arthrospira platensis FACHB-971]|uniref:Transposase n=1 Tax=Limnospira platensis NIES-46 TaxID=1236695 RepID=A0A5M3T3S5_LIMPL|nr:hypothetical protein [Arthrospira platensis]MBD2574401.1 hypothetical protein [Arthrospira platensis FACHB-971]MDF2212725.1 hypothetical protein [Arthrospira platensis NCB002]MDT9183674.1 hypothetical protein [Limnospira sp. PMC 289.06]MDT9297177.1 hypothetical protein [Arthrospira platensis PCC 7345]QQW31717.1 hypothetical protein AP9108_15440 [Arthrospira sp. PCC 9108]BDT13378.1 hypothetical protein N39L_31010 [Arthrospira platensis NIES-39]